MLIVKDLHFFLNNRIGNTEHIHTAKALRKKTENRIQSEGMNPRDM